MMQNNKRLKLSKTSVNTEGTRENNGSVTHSGTGEITVQRLSNCTHSRTVYGAHVFVLLYCKIGEVSEKGSKDLPTDLTNYDGLKFESGQES